MRIDPPHRYYQRIEIVSDGSAIPNPGNGRVGGVISFYRDSACVEVICYHGALPGRYTNNEAEYMAAIAGVRFVQEQRRDGPIHLRTDSELLVKQVHGEYRAARKFRAPRDFLIAHTASVTWHSRDSDFGPIADMLSRGDVETATDAIDAWKRANGVLMLEDVHVVVDIGNNVDIQRLRGDNDVDSGACHGGRVPGSVPDGRGDIHPSRYVPEADSTNGGRVPDPLPKRDGGGP